MFPCFLNCVLKNSLKQSILSWCIYENTNPSLTRLLYCLLHFFKTLLWKKYSHRSQCLEHVSQFLKQLNFADAIIFTLKKKNACLFWYDDEWFFFFFGLSNFFLTAYWDVTEHVKKVKRLHHRCFRSNLKSNFYP
jgi:hypothetical protein